MFREVSPMAERISDEAARSKTGRGWAEWFEILDQEGVRAELERLSPP